MPKYTNQVMHWYKLLCSLTLKVYDVYARSELEARTKLAIALNFPLDCIINVDEEDFNCEK